MKIVFNLCLLLGLLSPFKLNAVENRIQNLKVEYIETPLGIDVSSPRFSWQMMSDIQGSSQIAYQIIVTDESNTPVWDSGKTNSDISLNIMYAGSPLNPCTRYYWEVTVWNHLKKKLVATSWFETGLMNSNLSAWNGAKWIGGRDTDMVLYSGYLPVFKINFSLQLDEGTKSTKAGLVYGANDCRLLDKNKNLFNLENKINESYFLVEIDISPLISGDLAKLNVYRTGYHPDDKKNIPIQSISIPRKLVNTQNKYKNHKIRISSVLGYTHIYIEEEKKENLVAEFNLNPVGQGGDFIAFPVVGDIGFAVPKNQIANFSNVEIRNYRSPSNLLFSEQTNNKISDQSIFSNISEKITIKNNWYRVESKDTNTLVTANPTRNAMPMLRSSFSTPNSKVEKARLYITSRGIYDVFINGIRIGDDYFNPGITQYNKTHLYQTFDVTTHIQSGKNVIGAILGEGWWSGGATYMGDFWNFFGDRQSLLAKLVIKYTDGKEDIIVTDPSTWTYYNDGPVLYSSFFQGEVYDASKENFVDSWATAAYDDSKWEKAVEVDTKDHISTDSINKNHNMPMVSDYSEMALVGQIGSTVKKIKELTAISVEEVKPGVFVYDMGQNMAGVPKITLKDPKAGEKIYLRFAEMKYPNLPNYSQQAGMIMLENIRAAMAQDIYITKGGNEIINPRFTLHGYRFIEITGIAKPLPLDAVKAEVLSSIHKLDSKYETSDSKINKLWENITWSAYSNFISIPTDCPQRNERLGWSGDISIFSRTATYLTNMPLFLKRHMRAMRDTQRKDGRFSDVAPLGGGFGGILWGSAGITVAWESYQQYSDKEMLAEHYHAMKTYIDYLTQQIDSETNILGLEYRKNWGSLGDWLSPEYSKSEKTLLWEAYFIYDLELMTKIASILGETKDVEQLNRLHMERKEFFNKTYIDKQTGKTISSDREKSWVDTQASYTLPLAFNIVDEQYIEKFTNNFVSSITRETIADNGITCPPYSLMTGFIGTAWINKALSDQGRTDVAYRLLQQTSYPSWLYSVEQGATTIWERLNSYTHTKGFGGNNQMNSFNHYSFGAVGAWMYNHSLGIERDENDPGFKHFILKPEPDPTKKMTYAKGHYDSMYGRIESGWKLEGNDCYYNFTVPANTSATLLLKAQSVGDIRDREKPLSKSKTVKYVKSNNNTHVFKLPAGSYQIQVKNTP